MKIKNIKNFYIKTNNFLRTNQSNEIVGIPYLNPHVPRTIFLKNKIKFNFFKKIFNFLSRLLNLNKDYNFFKGINFKYIILSHFVSYDHLSYNNDFYFGDLAEKLGHKKVLFILIDHIGFDRKKLKKKIRGNYIILSKSSNFFDEFKMLFLTFFKIFYYQFFNNQLRIFNLNNIIGSIENQRISIKLRRIFKNIKFENFFFTFEGNPYEKLVCNEVRSINKNIIRAGYQFSVLRKFQHSIYQKINKNYEPDLILTIGTHNKRILESNFKKRMNIHNTGFFKFKEKEKNRIKIKNNKKIRILVMPEGIPSEIELFIEYCLNNLDKNIRFNFRMHPIFKKSFFVDQIINDKNIDIKISNNSLEYDFLHNDFILYRGTATVLNSLKYNLVPIYLSKNNEVSVDPLFSLNKLHIIRFEDSLSKFIINNLSKKKFIDEQKKLKNFSKVFYEKPKYKKIKSIIN